MKKFSLIPVFFFIPIISLFIFSFPAKAKAQEFKVDRWPTTDHNITSCYCWRCNPPEFHPGIDIGEDPGDWVFAVAEGDVVKVVTGCVEGDIACGGGYGNHVLINHEINGVKFQTLYAHLDQVAVSVGKHIPRADYYATPVGTVGNTGASLGPHLHFGIYKYPYSDSSYIDPLDHLPFPWTNDPSYPDASWCNNEYYALPNHPCKYSSVEEACGGPPPPPTPGKCTTCEDANISAPAETCNCDTNNGSTTVMTAKLDWTGHKAVGSCGSEIWDASCHTNCAKSFTCSAPEAYDTIVYDASGTATTVTVCPTGTWNPGSAYCTEKDGKTSWCDGTTTSLGLDPAEQSYWNAFCKDNPISLQINPYCIFLNNKMNSQVYGGGTLKETCLPWETATYATKPNLTCDDENCSTTAWTALADGDCEQTFEGSPAVFQSCPLHCECWGQCMAPVTNYHYYDGEGELDWGKDCTSTYSTEWEREKCRKINEEGIKLPVLFGWNMPTMSGERGVFPYDKYWLNKTLNSDVQSLIVKIDGIEKFLTADELLNVTKFKSEIGETKAKQLENFKKKCLNGAYPDGFLEFLNDTWDVGALGCTVFSTAKNCLRNICKNKDAQRLNQILYFIYFTEFGDAVGKPGSTFNYSISQDKKEPFGPCTLKSDKGYEWSARLCCGTDKTNCGPPSHVASTTERSEPYPVGSNKQFFKTSPAPEPVAILGSTIAEDGWDKPTTTDVYVWDERTGEGKKTKGYLPEHFTTKAIRWIDTDWNGPKVINLPAKEGDDYSDYVDFDWCSVTTTETFLGGDNRTYFKSGPPFYKLRAFYQYEGSLNLFATTTEIEQKKKEIRGRGLEMPPKCETPETLGFCAKDNLANSLSSKFCLCDQFTTPIGFSRDPQTNCQELSPSNIEICYPSCGKIGSPRLEWDIKKYQLGNDIDEIAHMDEKELQWKVQDLVEENCIGSVGRSGYGEKMAKEEAIIITEDPYLDSLEYGNGVEYKRMGETWTWEEFWKLWNLFERKQYTKTNLGRPWSWDYEILFFSPFKPIDWQVGMIEGKKGESEEPVYSQKWDFQISQLPPRKWDMENQEMTEIEPIKEIHLSPLPEKSTTTIGSDIVPAVNRTQIITWDVVERTLSYHLTFLDKEGKEISIPKEYSLVRTPEGKDTIAEQSNFHKIWPSLLNPPESKCQEDDFNCRRLDQEFTLKIVPCWDEKGVNCDPAAPGHLGLSQLFKTTGAKPTNLEPGTTTQNLAPDELPKAKIPRYLDWDDMPGAASYFYDIKGKLTGVVPQTSKVYAKLKGDGPYSWTVKTCADTCDKCEDEKMLQCGTSSDEAMFYGCELKPPEKPLSPDLGKQFYSASSTLGGEPVGMSWDPVECGTPNPDKPLLYQYKLEYATPANCRTVSKEFATTCEDIQNSEECQTLLVNPQIILFKNSNLSGCGCGIKDPDELQKYLDDLAKNALPTNMTTIHSLPAIQLKCLGTYNWSIRACLEHDSAGCKEEEAGDWSPFGYFNVVLEKGPPLPSGGAGFGTCKELIPCSWGNCSFTDIPKLIANIINCILWTLFPIALFGLVVYTGIVFYFAMGEPETLEKVKSIWKAGGKGFLIMFLAWTILNLIFKVLGWRAEIFGDWFNPL